MDIATDIIRGYGANMLVPSGQITIWHVSRGRAKWAAYARLVDGVLVISDGKVPAGTLRKLGAALAGKVAAMFAPPCGVG